MEVQKASALVPEWAEDSPGYPDDSRTVGPLEMHLVDMWSGDFVPCTHVSEPGAKWCARQPGEVLRVGLFEQSSARADRYYVSATK